MTEYTYTIDQLREVIEEQYDNQKDALQAVKDAYNA